MSGEGDPARRRPVSAVYLGLGSNLGDRAAHLSFGLRQLRPFGRITGVSSVYESEPMGYTDQPPFLNVVIRLGTRLDLRAVLDVALDIERRRGRRRDFRNAPRTLDIDVLTKATAQTDASGTSGAVIDEEGLRVPHPRMRERPFVLVPLLELEPELVDPETGRSYRSWLEALLAARDGPSGVDVTAVPGLEASGGLEALGLRRVMPGEALVEDAERGREEIDG